MCSICSILPAMAAGFTAGVVTSFEQKIQSWETWTLFSFARSVGLNEPACERDPLGCNAFAKYTSKTHYNFECNYDDWAEEYICTECGRVWEDP